MNHSIVGLAPAFVGVACMIAAMTSSAASATPPDKSAVSNPLLAPWTGPFGGVPPFDVVRVEHFEPALEAGMAEQLAAIERIAANPAAPTFDNTVVAYERSSRTLDRVMTVYGVFSGCLSDDALQAVERTMAPRLAAFHDRIVQNSAFFARMAAVHETAAATGLTAAQRRLAWLHVTNLVHAGARLDAAAKAELSAINQELAELHTAFAQNVLKEEDTSAVLLDAEADLDGLPEATRRAAAEAAAARGKAGCWAIPNTRSTVEPFLTFANRRDLRERVWRMFVDRGDGGGATDNNAIVAKILALRARRARLLGFATHAHWRLDDSMAKSPDRAVELMEAVWTPAVARVREEVADMQAIANADSITIAPWDYRFYAEKVRKAKYDLDQEAIKPYFQLDNMVAAMFDAAGKLYGLTFTENTGTVPVFEPKVRTFEVKRDGKVVGLFYLDNFARAGKRSGAWMTTYRSQHTLGGKNDIVLASNNNNFVPGADGVPTLISIDDASTLFHEFGHAIHYLNYDITWPGLGGTPRDFVEYPSQVNENWLLTPYVLNTYAKHYKTGEPIPAALVEKIRASDTFNQGFSTVEYLSSAILDMKLHNRSEPVTDPRAFERDTLAEIGMPKEMVMRHRLPQFNHLFADDGYSAGYYSYLWSETMDADTWAAFTEKGDVWDKETAERFRSMLLATGNETDRIEAYRVFRGRDPDVKYIMKKRGFPTGE